MTKQEKTRSALVTVLLVVAIIGALNWGLIGFFNWNLVDAVLGGGSREATSALSRVIYALVGLCGVGLIFLFPSHLSHTLAAGPSRRVPA